MEHGPPGAPGEAKGQTFDVGFHASGWDRAWLLLLMIPLVSWAGTPGVALAIGASTFVAVTVWRVMHPRGLTRLRIDSTGLYRDGSLLFARDPPRLGYLRPLPSAKCEVRLMSASGRRLCTLTAASNQEALALLEALALDALRSVVALDVSPPWRFVRQLVLQIVIVLLFSNFTRGGIAAAWPWLFGVPVALALVWPRKVRIGTDGVRVSWFIWHRFYPHTSIRLVDDEKRGVRLTLQDGSTVLIPSRESDALLSSIRSAQTSDAPLWPAASTLERQGRPTERWLASLGALSSSPTPGYRDAHLHAGQLWPILESSVYAPSTKAAAAMALRGSLGEPDRARLRRAAQSYAAPALAKVMEVVADADASDDELVAAVEAAERC
jgi:hypothetical protein